MGGRGAYTRYISTRSGVGKFLTEARLAKNLTHQRLAELINVTVGNISLWERNKMKPSSAALAKLHRVLGFNMEEYFKCVAEDAEEYVNSCVLKKI